MKLFSFASMIVLLLCLSACTTDDFTPKKKGYPRVYFPDRLSYKTFSREFCPFYFEIPNYAEIDRDSVFFNDKIDNPCWYTVQIKPLNTSIHLTYYDIDHKNSYIELIQDMHDMTFTHTVKADYIDQSKIQSDFKVSGLLYEVGGNAASPFQFYMTDSLHHFVRGSVYINTQPNIDSLHPVIDFIRDDMMHLLQSFRWTNSEF